LTSIAILIWVLNVTLDTIGHVALKFAAVAGQESASELNRWKSMLGSIPLWIGIICFCLEFVVWLAFLSVLSLSQGVLLGAINMVSIVIAGRLIFKERLDPMRIFGISLIAIGVILVGVYA
jgi:multidrug transporter EmrE-like cation transporter